MIGAAAVTHPNRTPGSSTCTVAHDLVPLLQLLMELYPIVEIIVAKKYFGGQQDERAVVRSMKQATSNLLVAHTTLWRLVYL